MFIVDKIKYFNFTKHGKSVLFWIFLKFNKDDSYMRMKGKCGRLINSDIGGNKVLSERERWLMKHKIC